MQPALEHSRERVLKRPTNLLKIWSKATIELHVETSGSSSRLRGGGVIELNRMTTIEAKLDALMNKLGN